MAPTERVEGRRMVHVSSDIGVYRDREHAGEVLAKHLEAYRGADVVILAIPNGGIPIGLRVRAALDTEFGVVVVRKLHIPWNREAGFGAVAPDGTAVFNEPLRGWLGLSSEEERIVIDEERAAIARRVKAYRATQLPPLAGRTVIIVDDGLASGYSMLAAVRFVRRHKPRALVVAVPTASLNAVDLVTPEADEFIAPNVRSGRAFAVADAYENWRDLEDSEVVELLRQAPRASRGR